MSPKSQQTCFLGGLVIMTMIYMFLYHLQTLFRLNEIRLANSRQIQCLPGSSLRELSIVCGISLMLCKFSQNNSQTKRIILLMFIPSCLCRRNMLQLYVLLKVMMQNNMIFPCWYKIIPSPNASSLKHKIIYPSILEGHVQI